MTDCYQAWYSPESRAEMRRKGAEAARRIIDGGGESRQLTLGAHARAHSSHDER